MNNKYVKITVIALAAVLLILVLMLAAFSGLGGKKPGSEEAAFAAAPEYVVETPFVTLAADGREITIEETAGKTVQQLLDQARVELADDDLLVLSPDQLLDGTLTIRVIRKCTVSVVMAAEDGTEESRCVIMMAEGTVADAIEAAGIRLEENHIVNYEQDQLLEDGMEILVSVEKVEEETEPETEPAPAPVTPSAPSKPKPTEPKPTEPKPTEPKPTEPERTIVSVEVYEDCDGSGHGVKVITYSDGTQEEVYF